MSKTRDFVEEIEANALIEFGGFSVQPFQRDWVKGVEITKCLNGELVHNRIVSFDEIRASELSGVELAELIMDEMNIEWDEYHFDLFFQNNFANGVEYCDLKTGFGLNISERQAQVDSRNLHRL